MVWAVASPGHRACPAAGRFHLHLPLGVAGVCLHALHGAALAATGSCQTGQCCHACLMPVSWLPPGQHGGSCQPCPRRRWPAGLGGMPAAGIQQIQRLISWQRSFRSNRRAAEGSGRAAAGEEEKREALADPPGTCGSGWAVSVAGCWTGRAGILHPAPGAPGQHGPSAGAGLGGSLPRGCVGRPGVGSGVCGGCWLPAITQAAEGG